MIPYKKRITSKDEAYQMCAQLIHILNQSSKGKWPKEYENIKIISIC
jgi:hypothetical protein